MKKVEKLYFEVGDIFEGVNQGGYLTPYYPREGERILVTQSRFIHVVAVDDLVQRITICGEGVCEDFHQEHIEDHLKRGNIAYLGNIHRRSK